MEFIDMLLKCVDCNAEFVFTAGEQLYFHEKNFTNDPKHCKVCKAKQHASNRILRETNATCAECGVPLTVPKPPLPSGSVPNLSHVDWIALGNGGHCSAHTFLQASLPAGHFRSLTHGQCSLR
jgi:hypothetical protein